jgi:hypothetical protein
MKPEENNITTLSEDIRQLANPPQGDKLDMLRCCRDHHDPYLLHDKKPVLDMTQDDFLGIFSLNSRYVFLSPFQVCRIGTYAKKPLPAVIALMLKAIWEKQLAEVSGYTKGTDADLDTLFKDPLSIDKYHAGFKPNRDALYGLLKANAEGSEGHTTYSRCGFYIRELMEGNIFLADNEYVVRAYPEEEITEDMLLHRIPAPEKTAYHQQKERWKMKSGELDDKLLYLEQRKRMNRNHEDKYFRTFAKYELEKARLTHRIGKYRLILELIPAHLDLSYRELVRYAEEEMLTADRERNEIQQKVRKSLNYIGDPDIESSGETVSNEFKNAYMDACRKMLKKLFFLLHSDTCPNYSGLSSRKKQQINELWLELMKRSQQESYSFSQSMMLYSLPDLEQLEGLYKRTCEILDIDPDQYEVGNRLEFMISIGTPVDQLMEFLHTEIENLELHLAHLELIQNEYTSEDITQYYRAALNDISAHSEIMREEIVQYKEEVKMLKQQIKNTLLETSRSQ